ncbi:hypothetical protein D3C76_1819510 [compost metagenome]
MGWVRGYWFEHSDVPVVHGAGEGYLCQSLSISDFVPDLPAVLVPDYVLRFLYAEQQTVEPHSTYTCCTVG